jgi:hypothetical protein
MLFKQGMKRVKAGRLKVPGSDKSSEPGDDEIKVVIFPGLVARRENIF